MATLVDLYDKLFSEFSLNEIENSKYDPWMKEIEYYYKNLDKPITLHNWKENNSDKNTYNLKKTVIINNCPYLVQIVQSLNILLKKHFPSSEITNQIKSEWTAYTNHTV